MSNNNNEFNVGDPVLHCDLPTVPLKIISSTIINGVKHYLIEKIGAPQHPQKLMLTSTKVYKAYWGLPNANNHSKLYKGKL